MNIKQILEEFDEKFPPTWRGDYTEHPLPELKAFLTQKLREGMEAVRPNKTMFEDFPNIAIPNGYNQAITDIETNITNFFKEL